MAYRFELRQTQMVSVFMEDAGLGVETEEW